MKALSVRPWWATAILHGAKTVECRTWRTSHRGDLLICSSARKEPGGIPGHALCIVSLESIAPLTKDDLDDACLDGMPGKSCYAWRLGDLRYVEPFPVKGRLNIFDVPDELIHVIWDGDDVDVLERVYKPLVYFGRDDSAREVWNFSGLRWPNSRSVHGRVTYALPRERG